MNNTINAYSNNNVSFNSRYLQINKQEEIPQRICDAIYKSDAVEKFLAEGKPKTLLGKFLDLFKRNEILNVSYETKKISKFDPYAIKETIIFTLEKGRFQKLFRPLDAIQTGIRRQMGCIPKEGEHLVFKAPAETSTERLAKQIEDIKDLNTLLQ